MWTEEIIAAHYEQAVAQLKNLLVKLEGMRYCDLTHPIVRMNLRDSCDDAEVWFMQLMVDNEKVLMTHDEIEKDGLWVN